APDLRTLSYAQGFVTARDRLWQMDIQARAGLGRLAEVLGPKLVRVDMERRRMGLPTSAIASLDLVLRDSLTRVAFEGYSEGVNAWISQLKPATYPIEFKLLDYAPEPWSPLKSVALIKNLQWTLSRGDDDVPLARVLDTLGGGFFSRYYPSRQPGAEPIFPGDVFPGTDSSGSSDKSGGVPSKTAGRSRSGAVNGVSLLTKAPRTTGSTGNKTPISFSGVPEWLNPSRYSGSNNFVLAGARTRAGQPILANDPHLDLTLPSIWYETQLKAGPVNAYGVSVPGLPGLVIGFTGRTAWGLTNGMDDVFDWVEADFRNDSLNQHLWKGKWRDVRRVVDTIAVRGADPVIDTQLWTNAGPIPVKPGETPFGSNTPPGCVLQWTAMQPSNEAGAFLRLLTAADVGAVRRAIRDIKTPTQNLVFASANGDIALFHQGRIPDKRYGQGRLVARGAGASWSEWRGYLAPPDLPHAVNPERGWLASANQEPTVAAWPHYLGSEFHPPERSQRLNRLLFNEHEATPASAWDILLDSYSRHAARALPLLLRFLPAHDTTDTTVSFPADAADMLRAWDYRYAATASAPVLFDAWWRAFYRRTWEDDFARDTVSYRWPSRPETVALLAGDTLDPAFDDRRTPVRESAGDLARAAFAEALRAVTEGTKKRHAPTVGGVEEWGSARPVRIPHLLQLPSFGTADFAADGCGECLNAQRGTHGPSWRMVVQTGRRPEALGIYPGGQSGNPGSPRYDA
ncbi:MAG TPA: penicillin acylase family protein, partial [Fibrobacteria bacterium]|nr:penicillin acylase family protein [Fibrobacteria bacterium]